MLKKIIGKFGAVIRGLKILNYEYFSTRNDCLGKCGVNSYYLPPTLLGKRENIFLYDNTHIDYRSVLYVSGGKLIIKENSIIAEGFTAITGQHQSRIGEVFGKAGNSNSLEKDIIVEEDVWIGASVILLSGAHIGRGAIVGAGTVVRNQDIPPYSIVVGNPAKVIGFRFTVEETLEHEELIYDEQKRLPEKKLRTNYKYYYESRIGQIMNYLALRL